MVESSFVHAHVQRLIEWIERLLVLGFGLIFKRSANLILHSLPNSSLKRGKGKKKVKIVLARKGGDEKGMCSTMA